MRRPERKPEREVLHNGYIIQWQQTGSTAETENSGRVTLLTPDGEIIEMCCGWGFGEKEPDGLDAIERQKAKYRELALRHEQRAFPYDRGERYVGSLAAALRDRRQELSRYRVLLEDQAPREAVLDAAGDAQSRTFAVGSDEGEARWWFGGLATIKATKEQTGGHYTLVEVLEPEGEGPLHVHYREDEGFWVLEGQLIFEVGEETIKAGPGSFVFGPKDVPHRFTVESGPARLLFILSPAGFEEFVYATSEPAKEHALPPAPEGPPSEAEMEHLRALARQYGGALLD
jgi:mannose-6-phosphate isomerase-like protein (cupin superfamily)